jgi:hypothetical protein
MLFYKSELIVCWIYLFGMIWVLSSMLNLSMIFWRIEYCMWSVKWIAWLCDAVENFKYYIWCLRDWCCDMFMDFLWCYHKLFWSILHWCMVTQSLEILESGTRILEPGTRLLGLGALGTCIYIYIYILRCVCLCGFSWYVYYSFARRIVCVWVLMDKSIRIFLLASCMI